ncbi:MAG: hypothetical protein IJ141_00120 [Lachnospiraceae bacterium]|nr:hypothetical protein [Lachnospiraceae bacterium]
MEIYTENDIKELLTLSSKQVRALMTTEGFPSIKVGSKYRVEAEKFKEWLNNTKEFKLDYTSV